VTATDDRTVHDLDAEAYRAHPALSVSGAKKLLPPSCPALYRYERDNPQQNKPVFDVGHAAHAQLLEVGAELVVVDADSWTTKAAREARDAAYAAGKTPLLTKDKAAVDGMTAAVRAHPGAAALFEDGRPEVSLFWEDWAHGVARRARLDWLTVHGGGSATVVDLKTCASAEPQAIGKAVANFGYHMQHAWYVDGVHALGLADDIRFLFVFVEKAPPHLVTVVELDGEAVRVGRARNDQALRIFADCEASGRWPGYADGAVTVSLPRWATPRDES
jgi:hypothetical protein